MISIENLSKSFTGKNVLNQINLTFEPGKVYGIVGENGAGKTTLFRCIAGLEDFEGEIKSDSELLKNVTGFLTTEPYFFSKMTGAEYLQLLCNARNIQLTNLKDKNVFDLPLNQYAETYSTGMKKKLAITGILLQQNELFILDEPYNGVDINSNILITQIIKKLKSLGKIVVIASHIFSTLTESCDAIHLLKEGKIIMGGDHTQFDAIENIMIGTQVNAKIDQLGLV
ncbi:MAG: ATP-binding cassette domain-containing protein [Ginsengibacter sp.]